MSNWLQNKCILTAAEDSKLQQCNYGPEKFSFDSIVPHAENLDVSYFQDIINELVMDHYAVLGATGNWRLLNVLHGESSNVLHGESSNVLHGESLDILHEESSDVCSVSSDDRSCVSDNNYVISDQYLLRRLENVDQVCVFYVAANSALWQCYEAMEDPMEKYLFVQIISTCFNRGFELMALEMMKSFPGNARIFMDNPGVNEQWSIRDQKAVFHMLFQEQSGYLAKKLLRNNGFFKNPYSLAGIIYTSGQTVSDLKKNQYRNGKELINALYQSSGLKTNV